MLNFSIPQSILPLKTSEETEESKNTHSTATEAEMEAPTYDSGHVPTDSLTTHHKPRIDESFPNYIQKKLQYNQPSQTLPHTPPPQSIQNKTTTATPTKYYTEHKFTRTPITKNNQINQNTQMNENNNRNKNKQNNGKAEYFGEKGRAKDDDDCTANLKNGVSGKCASSRNAGNNICYASNYRMQSKRKCMMGNKQYSALNLSIASNSYNNIGPGNQPTASPNVKVTPPLVSQRTHKQKQVSARGFISTSPRVRAVKSPSYKTHHPKNMKNKNNHFSVAHFFGDMFHSLIK